MNTILKKSKEKDLEISLKLRNDFVYDFEIEKIDMAIEHIKKCLLSDELKENILNYSYTERYFTGRWPFRKWYTREKKGFNWNKGLSNQEIYDLLLDKNGKRKIYLDLTIDRRRTRGVLGYTYPNTTRKWIYANFLSWGTYKDIAGNLVHEHLHNLGFSHARRFQPTRAHTVPYAIGYMIRDYNEHK